MVGSDDNPIYPGDPNAVVQAGDISVLAPTDVSIETAQLDLFLVDTRLGEGAYRYKTIDEYEDLNLLSVRGEPDRSGALTSPHTLPADSVSNSATGLSLDIEQICVNCFDGVTGIAKNDLGDRAIPFIPGPDRRLFTIETSCNSQRA